MSTRRPIGIWLGGEGVTVNEAEIIGVHGRAYSICVNETKCNGSNCFKGPFELRTAVTGNDALNQCEGCFCRHLDASGRFHGQVKGLRNGALKYFYGPSPYRKSVVGRCLS